jgi:hypothetical protein
VKPYSKQTRNRLLWLASYLDRRAAGIRRLVKARTPPRKAKAPKELPPGQRPGDWTEDMIG